MAILGGGNAGGVVLKPPKRSKFYNDNILYPTKYFTWWVKVPVKKW